jgi:hypothetical protein
MELHDESSGDVNDAERANGAALAGAGEEC